MTTDSSTPVDVTGDFSKPAVQPTLTVTKIVVNDDGGTAVVGDFNLFIDCGGGPIAVASGVANTVAAGTCTVSETDPGTAYVGTIGGDCDEAGEVTLAAGENKECTITNDDCEIDCDTEVGADIEVQPAAEIKVKFDQVTGAGKTTVKKQSTGPAAPAKYQTGTPAKYYDIKTTATFTGNVKVCVKYELSDYTPRMEKKLQLMHKKENQQWEKVTTTRDLINKEVCGNVTGFSIFSIYEFIPMEDFDDDGCTNYDELDEASGSEENGGLRDPEVFWDFYDTPTGMSYTRDKAVASTDFFALLQRFGSIGSPAIDPLSTPPAAPAYHTAFDRGASGGPNGWNLTAANGSIASTDFFAMLIQFGHTCT
jgi:hypothetical protein